MLNMVERGFYILKDNFFDIMADPYLKNNKDGNRPFYYCVKSEKNGKDVYWMIPLSSKTEKYQRIIDKKTEERKPCDGIYITKLPNGLNSVFLIQDIFPVTDIYIERSYTLGGNPLVFPYEKEIAIIDKKARKVISLIKRGKQLTPTSPNVIAIYEKL